MNNTQYKKLKYASDNLLASIQEFNNCVKNISTCEPEGVGRNLLIGTLVYSDNVTYMAEQLSDKVKLFKPR